MAASRRSLDGASVASVLCCVLLCCRFVTVLLMLLLVLAVVGGALLLHYWNHPEALPYPALQQLHQMSKQGPLQEACSSSSSSSGSFLQQQVCGWVQRALRVFPDEQYMAGGHDEL